MSGDAYLSTGEAAKWLNISRSTVSRKFDTGELQGKVNPITSERMISRDSVLALMKAHDLPAEVSMKAPKKLMLSCTDETLQSAVRTVVARDTRLGLTETGLGADTLISCSMDPPDLLILGEEIPDIACAEVIKSLRRRQEQIRSKILCCLRNVPPEQGLDWGADTYLQQQEWSAAETLQSSVLRLLGLAEGKTPEKSSFAHERHWPRYPVNVAARAGLYRLSSPRQHYWGSAVLQNISQGGAFLSPLNFEEGVSIPSDAFRLMLEVDQPPLPQWRAYCQVVRLQSNGQLSAGVQFVRLSHDDRQKIVALSQGASAA